MAWILWEWMIRLDNWLLELSDMQRSLVAVAAGAFLGLVVPMALVALYKMTQ